MRKCKSSLPHNQVDIITRIFHKPTKGPFQTFLLKKDGVIPKEKKRIISDYPGLSRRQYKNECVIEPWHVLTDMTVWGFKTKEKPARKQPKYKADYNVPHPYYEYTNYIYSSVRNNC